MALYNPVIAVLRAGRMRRGVAVLGKSSEAAHRQLKLGENGFWENARGIGSSACGRNASREVLVRLRRRGADRAPAEEQEERGWKA